MSRTVMRRRTVANTLRRLRNTLVQYQGGGYDGCFWEWNYAFYDQTGAFHCVLATGYKGCKDEDSLLRALDEADTDLYRFNRPSEVRRFGREAPLTHLLGVGKWLAEHFPAVVLTAVCDECGQMAPVATSEGEGLHGIGGIAMQYDKIICAECESAGTCFHCGEYVGPQNIDGETGYCTGREHDQEWCLETYGGD